MSQDLRRKIAYFGPREKVYATDDCSEIDGLPRNWRRVLCMSWPHEVIGPCGNVYSDTEHAIAAFRAHYTTNNPALAQLFRPENAHFQNFRVCRRWSTNNGLSLLMSDPDDRVWYVIRDRCMFDIIYQRVARDEVYRQILYTLLQRDFLPVYHVRTADTTTYWGAIINREKIQTVHSVAPSSVDLDKLADHCASTTTTDSSTILIGKNRLGSIMISAMKQYLHVYQHGMPLKAKISNVPIVPIIELTSFSKVVQEQSDVNKNDEVLKDNETASTVTVELGGSDRSELELSACESLFQLWASDGRTNKDGIQEGTRRRTRRKTSHDGGCTSKPNTNGG